jgi:gliding motility-associated-like protein
MGSAQINPQGGVEPYNVTWTGPSLNTSGTYQVTNLTPGNYLLTFEDLNTCQVLSPFTIIQTEHLLINLLPMAQYHGEVVSCYGSTDGTINVTIEDGRPPYQYTWSNGATTGVLENIGAGRYDVTISDESGCVGDSGIDVSEPAQMVAYFDIQDALCYGSEDGYIDIVDVSGGIEGLYFYNWQDTSDQRTRENLFAGIYTVSITDQNNCLLDTAITVNQPNQIALTLLPESPYCPDLHDGALEVEVTGGTPIMNYQWSTGENNTRIENLNQDVYSLTVTDANNCVADTAYYLVAERDNCLEIPNAFSPNNDGQNDIWEITIRSETGTENIPLYEIYPSSQVIVMDRWGNLVFKSTDGYTDPWNGNYMNTGVVLPVDSYHYIIELDQGKRFQGNITIVK